MTTQLNTTETAVMNDTATTFRIFNLSSLSAVMREIAEINAQQAEVEELYKAEMDRIKKWRDKQVSKLESDREWRHQQVIDYHQRRLEENPKEKTISTPYGTVKATSRKATFKKPDNDVLLAVLEAHGYNDLIKTKITHAADWAAYKKQLHITDGRVVDENGLIIDDIEIEDAQTTFKIEVTDNE